MSSPTDDELIATVAEEARRFRRWQDGGPLEDPADASTAPTTRTPTTSSTRQVPLVDASRDGDDKDHDHQGDAA